MAPVSAATSALELAGEPGLADTGRAQHGGQLRAPLRHGGVDHRSQARHLGGTSDEGGDRLGHRLVTRGDLVDGDGSGPAGDGHLTERLEAEVAARQPPCLLPHEDLTRPARLLEPSGDIQGVADQIGVTGGDDHLAGVDPDSHGERLAVAARHLGGEDLEVPLRVDTGHHGATGVVLAPPPGYRRWPSSRRP